MPYGSGSELAKPSSSTSSSCVYGCLIILEKTGNCSILDVHRLTLLPSDLLQRIVNTSTILFIVNKLRLQLTVEQLWLHQSTQDPLMSAFLSMCLCVCSVFIPSLPLKGPVGVRPKRCAKARLEIEKVMTYLGDIMRSCLNLLFKNIN